MPRFAIKSSGIFVAFIGSVSAIADWSDLVTQIRDGVSHSSFGIFYAYLIWEALWLAYEMLRLKIKYDLAAARWENRQKRRRRGK